MCLLEFIEKFDEADDEKQERTNINPEYCRRKAKRRGRKKKYNGSELLGTAQEDLQRWEVPPLTSSDEILEALTEGSN